MSVIISLDGTLNIEKIDGEFLEVLEALNLASASGKTFCAFDDVSGDKVMLKIPSILTAREVDD